MNIDRSYNRHGNVAEAFIPIVPRPRRRRASRFIGTSLVEVLIVLVVILIGVFAIIQIFPIGFKSLQNSEARLRADRLARNVTESLSADANGLPESITFSYWNAGSLNTVANEDPDNLGLYQNDPANRQYFSDVNKFRYVTNEPVKIALPSGTGNTGFGNGVGSVHFLTFGPIYMDTTVGDSTTAPDYTSTSSVALYDSFLKVTSQPLARTAYDSLNGAATSLTLTDYNANADELSAAVTQRGSAANAYLIDYGNGTNGPFIMLSPTKAQTTTTPYSFTVQYRYNNAAGAIGSVVAQYTYYNGSVSVEYTYTTGAGVTGTNTFSVAWPAAGTQFWVQLPIPPADLSATTNPNTVLPGSDVVTRRFTRLPSTTAWDTGDPYQYKLVENNFGTTNANLGVLAFNPAGANYTATTSTGTQPFTALVSYAVLDWHILHDDREVDGGGRVRTTLPNIRVKGEAFTDLTQTGAGRNQTYPGLFPGDPTSPDLLVYNLSDPSGKPRLLTSVGDYSKHTTTDANADYWISRSGRGGTYPSGIVYLNTAPGHVVPGSKVRILYKAEGDWAVALQKAATAYHNSSTDASNTGINTTNYGNAGANINPPAGTAIGFSTRSSATISFVDDRIEFSRSELNKSAAAVIEIDVKNKTTSNIRTVRLPARQFNIDTADGDFAYKTLSDFVPEVISQQDVDDNPGLVSRQNLVLDPGTEDMVGWRVFGNINGASLKTRVIWQDEQNGRNPWRVSDLETFITRQAQ